MADVNFGNTKLKRFNGKKSNGVTFCHSVCAFYAFFRLFVHNQKVFGQAFGGVGEGGGVPIFNE